MDVPSSSQLPPPKKGKSHSEPALLFTSNYQPPERRETFPEVAPSSQFMHPPVQRQTSLLKITSDQLKTLPSLHDLYQQAPSNAPQNSQSSIATAPHPPPIPELSGTTLVPVVIMEDPEKASMKKKAKIVAISCSFSTGAASSALIGATASGLVTSPVAIAASAILPLALPLVHIISYKTTLFALKTFKKIQACSKAEKEEVQTQDILTTIEEGSRSSRSSNEPGSMITRSISLKRKGEQLFLAIEHSSSLARSPAKQSLSPRLDLIEERSLPPQTASITPPPHPVLPSSKGKEKESTPVHLRAPVTILFPPPSRNRSISDRNFETKKKDVSFKPINSISR